MYAANSPNVVIEMQLNALFAPARLLFFLVGIGGRIYLLTGFGVLIAALAMIDDPSLRRTLVGVGAVLTLYFLFALLRSIVESRANLQEELIRIGSGDLSIAAESMLQRKQNDAVNLAILRTRSSRSRA
jgi:hypothetical protein